MELPGGQPESPIHPFLCQAALPSQPYLVSCFVALFRNDFRCVIEDELHCMPSPKTEQKILKKPPNVRNGEEIFWVLVVPDENWVLL